MLTPPARKLLEEMQKDGMDDQKRAEQLKQISLSWIAAKDALEEAQKELARFPDDPRLLVGIAGALGALSFRYIAPGLFGTQTLFHMEKNLDSRLAHHIPFPHRFGDAAEFAMLVIHVLNNVMINGTVLRLDGGYHR